MVSEPFLDVPPQGDMVTAYDLAQTKLYLRLFDAAADKSATWQEVVRILFGIDPVAEPARARQIYDSHLARARWMSEVGYRQLAGAERYKCASGQSG